MLIALTAPAAAASLQDGAVLRGTASGTGSALISLRYAFDNAPLAPLPFTADGGFSQRLDLGTLAVGAHTLKVVALDAAGNIYIAETNYGRRVQRFGPVGKQ